MHDTNAEGNDYFKCDFCHQSWSDERPMIEGHQGSLICAKCLSTAYSEVVYHEHGQENIAAKCGMCLETRSENKWASPMYPEAIICRRCIKQGAVTMERDEEMNWKRPPRPE